MMEPVATASSSSSDDEDDAKPLKNNNNNHHHHQHRSSATFEIFAAATKSRAGRCFRIVFGSRKWLLAICLPLLLLLSLLFFFDLRRIVPVPGISAILPAADVSPADRMRESELQALYLLRDQQFFLHSIINFSLSANSSNSTSFGAIRSALLQQINLNQQIQKTLLSPHRAGNSTSPPFDAFNVKGSESLNGLESNACRRSNVPDRKRTIEWKPQKDRFLLGICVSGQMSNHLICLEKHMFFAALLGRILVLPSHKFDYQYDRVLDIRHINDCFGRNVVMEFKEFEEMKKHHVHINRLICYMASPPCFLDDEHIKKLKGIGVSLGKMVAAWPEDAKSKENKRRVVDDIKSKFSTDDEVIAVGDLFYAAVEEEWVMQPGGPLEHKCESVIQPSRPILLTAQRFIQTFLGGNYIAVHFRRHGFLKFCNAKNESCFFPVPQAAKCILRVVERSNAPVIYLSTDAAESETGLLQSLVVLDGKPIPLIKRPGHNSIEKWDAILYRKGLGGDNQVEAMLDKTLCAMSTVFIGSSGSTFTDDIVRLRRGWRSASVCDENLCQGERPSFIAELQ